MDALGLWITIFGTILTAIGTAVTVWHAVRVRNYREQIAFDLRKIRLSETREHLRRAQDESRRLLTPLKPLRRGADEAAIIHAIQVNIDNALNLLNMGGSDADVRRTIVDAQNALRGFQEGPDRDRQELARHYDLIQDAISLCRERIVKLDQVSR